MKVYQKSNRRQTNATSFSILLICFLLFMFGAPLLAQQSPDAIALYKTLYKTAIQDGQISAQEQAMIDTLQEQLQLSHQEISAIINQLKKQSLSKIDQSGRWQFVLQNMGYGSGMYGWMLPYVLGVKETKWLVASEMFSVSTSFYLSYRLTEKMPISLARAHMLLSGSTLGLLYGFQINNLLDLDRDRGKGWAYVFMGSVPLGYYLGDRLYHRWQPDHGFAWVLSLGGEMGGTITLAQLHDIIEPRPVEPLPPEPYYSHLDHLTYEEKYKKWEKEYTRWQKRHALYVMAGYPLGLWLTQRYLSHLQYSFGDALMLAQGVNLGLIYGLTLADIIGFDFDKNNYQFMTMSGAYAGGFVYHKMIQGYDYSFGQSVLTALGTVSGAAFGLGCVAILELESNELNEFITMSSSMAGTYFITRILERQPERRSKAESKDISLSVYPQFLLQPSPGLSNKLFAQVGISGSLRF